MNTHRLESKTNQLGGSFLRVHLWPVVVGLALAFSVTGCAKKAETAAAPGLVKVRFQTDWFPQPEHGGY